MMKKQKIPAILSCVSIIMLTGIQIPVHAGLIPKATQVEKILTSESSEEDASSYFSQTCQIGEDIYYLSDIKTEVVEKNTVPGQYLEYQSPVFDRNSSEYVPEDTMEKDGTIYKLHQSELVEQTVEQHARYAEGTISYHNVEWLDKIPDTGIVTVKDEQSGQEISGKLPLISQTQTEDIWSDTFVFPIVVSDYDAPAFMLNETEIPDHADLTDYAGEFLDYLGLPSDYYRITKISWDGEPYRAGGSVCRKAEAKGQKLVHEVNATYGGNMTIPSYQGYSYHCIYVDESKPDTEVYTIKATGTYILRDHDLSEGESGEEKGTRPGWLGNWSVNIVIIIFLIGIALSGFLLLIRFIKLKKKKRRKRAKADTIKNNDNYKGETDEKCKLF